MSDKFIEVEHLRQYFPAGGHGKHKKYIQAVDDVSFSINRGETLGLVGESGCGKTTTGRALLRLYQPTGGRFTYDGDVVFDVEKNQWAQMLPYRKKMQIVFQDPYASLDPRMTVGDIVGEAIDTHNLAANKQERYELIIDMLRKVGLNSEHANRYPHFPVDRDSVLVLQEPLQSIQNLLSVMSRSPHWMYPFRHRSSTCLKTCRKKWV